MRILAVESTLPPYYYPQDVLIEAFRKHWGKRLERFDILERLHAATQVNGRYLSLPLTSYPLKNWGQANDAWIETALNLGQQAICRAITCGGTGGRAIDPKDIGAFIFVSITGVASPSIEGRLINRMKLAGG